MEDWLVDETSEIFKDDQLPHYNHQPIDWKYLIEETMAEKDFHGLLDGMTPTEKGNHIHEWLEEEFSDIPGISWEQMCESGRYDAYDGRFVYEFKTKHDHRIDTQALPLEEDEEQVNGYVDALDADYGVVVYLGRGSFTVDEYLTRPDGV